MTEGTQKTLDREPDERATPADAAHGHSADVLSRDLLRGADTIAEFVFGNKAERRKVYHLAETSRLPVFRLGSVLCARRSVLMAWIADQEQRALRGSIAPPKTSKD